MKKIFYSSLFYFVLIIILELIFIPEKFKYGHYNDYKILEFLTVTLFLPIISGFIYFLISKNKNRATGLSFIFLFMGFFGLLATTFIVKTKAHYQIDKNGIYTQGIVDSTYYKSKSSKSYQTYSEFIVKFEVDGKAYYSLPGFTDDDVYFKGDVVKVKYLKRNPWLNRIYYRKE
jgi:hypothetical protein